MSALTAPLAVVDDSRQIVVVGRDGRFRPLTRDELAAGVWSRAAGGSDTAAWAPLEPMKRGRKDAAEATSTWSWPTWSPDGRRLACFRFGRGESGSSAFVNVLDVDGVHAAELFDLDGRVPVYVQWHEDGRDLAVLSQKDERLVLSAARPDEPGFESMLAEGSPLFFTWLPGRPRVAAFVGNTSGGHVGIYDPRTNAPTQILPGRPGNFCTPVVFPDGNLERVLYVAFHEGRTAVLAGTPGSAEPRAYETIDGLVALVASPDRQRIARAVAPGGDGTPYRQLAIIDVRLGHVTPVHDGPCLAFVWTPDGQALLVAHVDTERNLLVWTRVPLAGGSRDTLCEMYPSRDLSFHLRFFEQYADSHALVDPTSRYLVVAGVLADKDERSRVWQIRLADGRAEAIADGLYGVYGPSGD